MTEGYYSQTAAPQKDPAKLSLWQRFKRWPLVARVGALGCGGLVALFALLMVIGTIIQVADPEGTEERAAEAEEDRVAQEEQEAEEEVAEPDETAGQRNARSSAESYLNYTAFSREGLIGQLEFEDFSREDAEYAVDNVEVDWYEQAELSAESYLDYTSFSLQGLIDQLMFEGFTPEQAEHGANEAY